MSTTTKSLALTAVIASSIAVMAADSAPRSRADELRPAAPGSATQGSSAQSTSGQGSSAQGTWDAVTLGRDRAALGRDQDRGAAAGRAHRRNSGQAERGSVRRRAVGAPRRRGSARARGRGRGAGRVAQARAQRSVGARGFGRSAQGRGRGGRRRACCRRRARGARQDHRRLAGESRDAGSISMRRAPRSRARRIACASGAMRS